jgi:Protein of unknown function (DUF5674)
MAANTLFVRPQWPILSHFKLLIILIRDRATPRQMEAMLSEHKFFIKLAIDIELSILAGGGEMHFDCEQMLLSEGSRQENIWGAGFMPETQKITYDSLINIRSRDNRSMEILSPAIRDQLDQVIIKLLGDV